MIGHASTAQLMSTALLLACTTYLAVNTYFFSSIENPRDNNSRRILNTTPIECQLPQILQEPDQTIIPVYAPSYPGSGSGMTHYLYEALTGLEAGNSYNNRGDEGIYVALRTHYPVLYNYAKGASKMDRCILHLRNPLYALPSYASQRFEHVNDIPTHTQHAPLEFWIQWRDKNFVEEIKNWAKHMQYWVNNYDNTQRKRIVISYEHLIHEETGPEETAFIADFLREGDGVSTVPPENVPCVWDRVVNYEKYAGNNRKLINEGGKTRGMMNEEEQHRWIDDGDVRTLSSRPNDLSNLAVGSTRGGDKVEYIFTRHQLQTISDILNMLKEKYQAKGNEDRLVKILDEYLVEVGEKLREASTE